MENLKKNLIIFFLILLALPLINSLDSQLQIPCGVGDAELQIGCGFGDSQLGGSFWSRDYIIPVITIVAPLDRTEDTDTVLDFYYTVSDANPVRNCSVYLDNSLEQTNTTIIKTETQHFIVQNPPVKDDLRWYISCRDLFNNIGNSTERKLDTLLGHGTPEGGGGGGEGLVNITEEEPEVEEPEEPKVEEIPEKKFPFFLIWIFIFLVIALLAYERRKKLLSLIKGLKIKRKK